MGSQKQQRLINHISTLNDEERLLLVRKEVNSTLGWLRKSKKSSDSEFNYKGSRGGRSNAKNQTLNANSYNNTRMYDQSLEELKMLINLI